MDPTSRYAALISGRTRGAGAGMARGGLRVLAFLYGRVMAVRNAYYDTWAMPQWLDVPVISVGNLTVGGTGKTPMTVWLCERLLARGRKPAVLSRGYRASEEGIADELLVISRQVPKAVAVAHADRARAGRLAIEQYQVRSAILDDGFQHRRLGRDLDIVLVDATRPFGYGYILPRGLLRERIGGIRRADAVVITRCDQADPDEIDAITRAIREWARDVPIVRAVHEPAGFTDLAGRSVDKPRATRPGCVAGIARPDAFVRTLAGLGLAPVASTFYPDHHAYSTAEVESLAGWIREQRLDCLLTTEKDAVKLARLNADWPVPVVCIAVRMRMLANGEAVLDRLIDRMLREHEEPTEGQEMDTDGQESQGRQG
ncbi:MAG: tetraacyldisaccharide 4'-kinase [Planctomycetes bacterium]|nr:tetraacyldisaccharide 4'-kinase [Planctomycetota bacterium]